MHFGANSELTLTGRKDPAKPEQNPALYEFVPTDALRYHGAYVKDDVTKGTASERRSWPSVT